LQLFRKHPDLLGDGTGLFGRLDAPAVENLRDSVGRRRKEVEDAAAALEKFDAVDFRPYFQIPAGQKSAAEDVMELFARAVPQVYFHYFYESFLEAWDRRSGRNTSSSLSTGRWQVPVRI
jgi:hypothetical protein